jgi:cell division septal protein FtsQ
VSGARLAKEAREPFEPRLHAPPRPEPTLRRLPVTAHRRRDRPWLLLTRRTFRLLLVVAALSAFGGWLVSSPVFALREVSVAGEGRVSRPWIDSALADWRGDNLLLLDLREVEARLRGHRWVRAVALHKRLPDRLAVEVLEHRPVAVLVAAEHAHYVSDQGFLIAPIEDTAEPLLVLRLDELAAKSLLRSDRALSPAGAAALRGALEVVSALQESALRWAGEATEVVLASDQDYRVSLRGLAFPVVVRPDTPRARIAAFDRVLPALEREVGALSFADLRFTRRIVVQPRPPAAEVAAASIPDPASSTEIQ